MRKRPWRIEWHASPQADGVDRLGRAMDLLLKKALEETGNDRKRLRRDELEARANGEVKQ
jgi:hypothetical protein